MYCTVRIMYMCWYLVACMIRSKDGDQKCWCNRLWCLILRVAQHLHHTVGCLPRTRKAYPEIHTKRQATQHDCLPSLQVNGDKGIDKPNEPTKRRPLSFVLFESPFTSVSTVSRGYPSLVSLGKSWWIFVHWYNLCFFGLLICVRRLFNLLFCFQHFKFSSSVYYPISTLKYVSVYTENLPQFL